MEGKKTLNRIGLIYGLFTLIIVVLQMIIAFILKTYFYDFTMAHSVGLTLAMTFVVEHVIGFGVLLLLVRRVPGEKIVKKNLSVGMFISAFFIMFALMELGGLLGNYVQYLTTGDTANAVTDILLSSSPIPRILVIGICAPVVEEFVFRKLLIDRLIKFGSLFAVITSGVMFGLIHGNFSQFFYAFLLGAFFAAIYVKTGQVKYTIILHMIVNMSSSVIGVYVLEDYAEKGLGSIAYLAYALFIFASAIAGIVMIIINSKKFVPHDEDVLLEGVEGESVSVASLTGSALVSVDDEDPGLTSETSARKKLVFGDIFYCAGMYFYFAMMVVMFLVNYGIIGI